MTPSGESLPARPDPFTTAQPGPSLVPARPHRAYWLPDGTWVDPDCCECGGEGAPCCDPPYLPPELDRLREQRDAVLALCDRSDVAYESDDVRWGFENLNTVMIRRALGVTS